MKLLLAVVSLYLFLTPPLLAQRKSWKTGLSAEELQNRYQLLAHKRLKAGGIILGAGLVAGAGGALIYNAGANSYNSNAADYFPVLELLGGTFMALGFAATITGGSIMLRGAYYNRKARLVLVNEPVPAFRIGRPTSLPGIALRIPIKSR
jgi:hypothetical protein